jgi:pimeloyl-ACP methyl ester carboxylesterase
MWGPQVKDLSDIRRVIAPDLPGHGSDRGEPVRSVDAMADHLAQLLDSEGIDKVDLAGFSMGGYVSFAFWRRHKDRVRSLVLVDTKAPADNEQQAQGRLDLTEKVRAEGPSAAAGAMLSKLLTEAAPADARALAERMIMESAVETIVADLAALRSRPDSVPTLTTIDVPTLIIVGDQDAITPLSEAEAMAAGIAGSSLMVVPGAAHLTTLEQPAAVSKAIRAHLAG